MLYTLLGLTAIAEKLVVVESDDLTATANQLYQEQTVVLSWSEMQGMPLLFSNAVVLGDCSVYPKKISDVETSLGNVGSALDYMELEKADGHMVRVENNLRCLDEPVTPELLSKIYFISGLTHFYRKEEEKTIEQWTQAYSFNEELIWDEQFEPSGKSLFEETLTDLKFTAQSTLLLLPSSTSMFIDGVEKNNQSDLHSGKHLVQHGEKVYSHLIQLEEGQDVHVISLADFPNGISDIMDDENSRAELLKAFQLGTEYSDYVILTEQHQWTVIPGSNDWKSVELQDAINNSVASIPTDGKKRRLYLAYTSIGTATLSGLSFFLANKKYEEFMTSVDDPAALKSQNQTYFLSGVGLGVVSSGLMIAGVTKW
jgi:hypothetical protein